MDYNEAKTLFTSVNITNLEKIKNLDNDYTLKCIMDFLNADTESHEYYPLYQEKLTTIDSIIQIP